MICRYCGTEFEPKKRGRKNQGFCCKKCADNWRQHNIYDLQPKKYTKQCFFCGEAFQTNRENQKYCSTQCSHAVRKTGRTVYTKKCLYCDAEFTTIYKEHKYCTSACASRHAANLRRGEYFCEYCGKLRHSDHPNRNRFCSQECAAKAKVLQYLPIKLKREQEEREAYLNSHRKNCAACGKEFQANVMHQKYCSPQCKEALYLTINHNRTIANFIPVTFACAECGIIVKTTLNYQRTVYCSDRCAAKHHKKDYKKRRSQQIAENFVEPVDLKTTYKSYHGVCGICGLPVPEHSDSASDWGPTVDHIVPLSKGGKHMKSNCQLAHRLCNSLKLDTTDDFMIDWRQKLIDEPGQWNARLDTLWEQLHTIEGKMPPIRITIQPTTTLQTGVEL